MKRFAIALLLIVGTLTTRAQVIFDLETLRGSLYDITLEVKDSLTNEPIAFASVYLNAPKDTVINHFTLSDADGKAVLEDVPGGDYYLNIEFLGYYPAKKHFFLRGQKEFGTILLAENPDELEAAKVSALANPVEFLQDTTIFNAAAFSSNENDVLQDLLRRMPGIEVGADGDVKVHGKSVSKITVNGKTFFMGDKTAALQNIPAQAVDKVKVVDKQSDAAAFSGIKDDAKETVMDVQLKQEYSHGLFGNAKLNGGVCLPSAEENEFLEARPILVSGSAMVSAFGDKDQATLIANGMNADGTGESIVYSGSSFLGHGIHSSAQAGVNYNTDRVKGYDSNATLYWRYNGVDGKDREIRTTMQPESEDILSWKDGISTSDRNYLSAGLELENKDKAKYNIIFKPGIAVSHTLRAGADSSSSIVGGALKNWSTGATSSNIEAFTTNGDFTFGIKNLGNPMRSLTLTGNYRIDADHGTETETHRTWLSGSGTTDLRALNYDRTAGDRSLYTSLQYVEPLSDKVALQTTLTTNFDLDRSAKDAFNPDGTANTYYTARSESNYTSFMGRMLLQLLDGKLRVGALARSSKTVTRATSMGIDTESDGNWLLNWSPFVRYSGDFKDGSSINIGYNGVSDKPDHSFMLGTVNISNPTFLTIGNINLQSSFSHSLTVRYNKMNREKKISTYLNFRGSVATRQRVDAVWFDSNSIRYSLPVNARHPSINLSLYYNLTKQELWFDNLSFSSYGSIGYSRSVAYQAPGTLAALDLSNFDYNAFMANFWGIGGDNFYNGTSGFQESLSRNFDSNIDCRVSWRGENLNASFSVGGMYAKAMYSLNSQADTDYYGLSETAIIDWNLPKDYSARFSGIHIDHFGYGALYNKSRTILTASLNKNIKSWTLTLRINDILNDGATNYIDSGPNYVSSYFYNNLGRNIIFGVSYRFGKMNATQNRNAQTAMWRML